MSTVNTNTSSASANSALQQAAQSIISGSTGNSTMDVNSLVTALVNAKTASQAAAITAKQTADNTQISAYGTLSAALSALQASLTTLSDGTMLNKFSATASGDGITATAGTGAVAGTYSVGVRQIASAQVLTSQGFQPSTQTLGTGSMTLTIGGKSSTITIDSSNNTVAGIAAAINGASDNPGVSATVVNGVDGAHLVLRSTATGAANVINTTVTGSVSSALAVSSNAGGTPSIDGNGNVVSAGSTTPATNNGWTQSAAAQDAYVTIDGTAVTSASNTLSSAMSGVTLNLTSAAVGTTPQVLTVAADTTSQSTAINNFVNLYNTLVTTFGTLTSYSPTATTQGPLLGDSTLNIVQNGLASVVAGGVKGGGTTQSLASIGITLQADGTLSVDSTTLTNALQNNSSAVSTLFNSTTGVAAKMNTLITGYLATGGPIQTRTSALNADLTSLTTQQSTLSNYQTQLTNQYQAQFTALNTLMATMNNNSQYLTQLFGGTNSQGAMSANKS
ncbi:flagellar hook protein FliD [Burkholderia pseudomultivorans]|uniref:flagellar filament capping protein FliD n=1 Tax=Burkholderia pseudomultivorans TaxID=1207504 RepID=UPI000759BD3A|nr:flagellar filament capping protein FliD [Burkholderia pseudomultivorans]KWI62250.1 flagellar hook protein FliD [Burkholderia pseudomultivorans]